MKTILKQFIDEPLFDACAAMLQHLHISFNEVTRTPVPFEGLYRNPLTKALQEILPKVEHTYFIGTVDEASLSGHASVRADLQSGLIEYEHLQCDNNAAGRYVGMMIFAVDIKCNQTLTRTEMAMLNQGQVMFRGSPAGMLGETNGKVWRLQVTNEQYAEINQKYAVISTIPHGLGWDLQVVSKENPGYGAVNYPPNLEHAYVYFTEIKDKD